MSEGSEHSSSIMAQYRDFFVQEAGKVIKQMRDDLERLAKEGCSTPLCAELERCAHNLKSSSGMMGYSDFRELCIVIEDVFDRMEAGRLKLDREALAKLMDSVKALEISIRSVSETGGEGNSPAHAIYSLKQLLDVNKGS